mgnify:CR=1 FL=1
MHVKLINSLGCELDEIDDKDTFKVCEKIGEWIDTAQAGDTIKIIKGEENDPMDDFNYVGSRHHY